MVARNLATPYADDAQLMLAKCYYTLGDYSRAIKEAKQLGRKFPDSQFIDSANLLIAGSYLTSGDSLKATIAYVDALRFATKKEIVKSVSVELKKLSKKLSLDDLYILEKRCENTRAEPTILLSIAEKEIKRGDHGAAKTALNKLVQLHPDMQTLNRTEQLLKLLKRPTTIKIGLIAPLSGEYSIYGDALRKGVELALSEYERVGLVLYDSKGDPIEAVEGVRKLVYEKNVIAIIGPLFTKTVIPAAITADYLDIPLISPTATDERISSLGEYVFQLDTGLKHQVAELAAYSIRRIGLRRFAIIYPKNGYGRLLSAAFSAEVVGLGGEVLVALGYESGKTDFKEEIDTLKEYSPEAIFIPAYADDVIMIATQLRYYEVEVSLLGANGWKSSKLLALAGEYIEGSIFTAFDLNVDTSQIEQEFTRLYRERYAEDPIKQSAQGFDAAQLIIEAVSRGMDNPYALRNFLNSAPLLGGASGLIYTAKNPSSHIVKLYKIEKGKIEKIM